MIEANIEAYRELGRKIRAKMERIGLTHASQIRFSEPYEVGPATTQMQRIADANREKQLKKEQQGPLLPPGLRQRAISRADRFKTLARFHFTCVYCGRRAPEVTLAVDHLRPVAKHGTDSPRNLVAACWDCNAGKGEMLLSPEDFARYRDMATRFTLEDS